MARRTISDTRCGLVQIIRLHWDKSARGGQGARDRNAVPLAFGVPADQLLHATGQLHVEESHWGDSNAFAKPFHYRHHRVPVEAGFSFACVTISEHPQGLLVRYRWSWGRGGAPDRWFINAGTGNAESASRDLVVQAGQWARVSSNGRFTDFDTGNWWYEQVTVNVAWFDGEPSGQVFVGSAPVRDFRQLANLW
jgi:hypothetical protein